jgi:energy-coupling factor transport system substrate-specific component
MSRVLRALELPVLAAVPVVMALCVIEGVDAGALLTALAAVLAVGLMLAGVEASRPAMRQLMPTVVLAALAAAGRLLFAAVPDVKPVSAIAIVAGATLGPQSGFAVGALAALVSNLFFGQGAWTPWQMYAWGLVGYVAGFVCRGEGRRARIAVYVWGFCSALMYGAILNGFYVIGFVRPLAWQTALAAVLAALPFDLIHGMSTVGFLLLVWTPWRASIRRVVAKYGLSPSERADGGSSR